MRIWIRLFALTLLLLALPLPAEERQQAVSGLLWEITAPRLQSPSYLFGTIHSEDERVLALPAEVKGALQRSALFVMEIEPTVAAQEQASRRMMQGEGQRLAMQLDASLYKQTIEVMARHGLPEEVTSQLKPWAVVMVLSMPKPRNGLFLDLKLYLSAIEQKKQVAGLESADEQVDVLDAMPLAAQIAILRHTLVQYEKIAQQLEELHKAWLARDLSELERLAEESNAGLPRDIEAMVQARLVDERNRRMVERMEPLMKKQSSFVAVGALHLPGEQGIISLLRQRGYTVKPVW